MIGLYNHKANGIIDVLITLAYANVMRSVTVMIERNQLKTQRT